MPNFPKNTSPAMYKPSGFKMKNSTLHKSAKHGSPMQQNYDNPLYSDQSFNNSFNKKDFVSTHVKEGITVPKKTTLENLTKKQTGPLEGGKSKTPTTNSRKMQGLKNAATEVITETTQEINTLDNKKGKLIKNIKNQNLINQSDILESILYILTIGSIGVPEDLYLKRFN